MLIKASDLRRLPLIDRFLRGQQYEALEVLVEAEAPQGLLDDETLAAARAMNLMPTVIYLASLGLEKLPNPGDRPLWVEVYRTLGRNAETEGFQALPNHLPLKWVVQASLSGKEPDTKALERCHGKSDDWQAAYELTLDQHRLELTEHLTSHLLAKKVSVEVWLQIVGMMIARQPLLINCPDTAPLARSLIRICKRLPETPNLRVTRSTLALQAGLYFQRAGEHVQALRAAELATDRTHHITRQVLIAESNCHQGNLQASIERLDRLLQQVGTQQFKDWQATYQPHQAGNHQMFAAASAAQALVALQGALDRSGQKAFLVSGTLLGYAREGQLLAHDKDIDVGVLNWESQFDVALALLESREFIIDMRTMIGAQTYHLPVKHLATGTDIDVFLYHPEDGKLVTGVQSQFGYLQKFAFTPFGLEQAEFLGINVYVPDNVDLNLRENFGDWRASDPGYISHLESPSTVDVGGLVYQLVGRLQCLEALRKRNRERLLRALDCLEREQQQQGGMRPTLLQLLRETGAALAQPETAEASA